MKTVMVAGKILVRDGVVLTTDEDAARAAAQAMAGMVSQNAAADPVHKGIALTQATKRSLL
jgi:hypothetical protein